MIEGYQILGYSFATANDILIESEVIERTYHGTSDVPPGQFHENDGLPKKGTDIDLIRHVEPPPGRENQSAFRGTVIFPMSPIFDTGACYWAGTGGWVYEIKGFRGYDINKVLEKRIPDGKGGYRDPLMAEQEIAIPAEVPKRFVERIGDVIQRPRGPSVDWH